MGSLEKSKQQLLPFMTVKSIYQNQVKFHTGIKGILEELLRGITLR